MHVFSIKSEKHAFMKCINVYLFDISNREVFRMLAFEILEV